MNYNVITFYKGDVRRRERLEASAPLQAAKLSAKSVEWTHIMVYGNKINRYVGKKLKAEKSTPSIYKAYWKAKVPSILLMYGTTPEFYKFETEKERDIKYEEMKKCITSMSVEYAKAEAALTDIIVSLDEIRDSKNTSMSKKTSSGSAMSATCRATLILPSIDKRSGTDNAEDTATNTWFDGLEASRSRHNPTFFATVKTKGKADVFPGINSNMLDLDGTTMEFRKRSRFYKKTMYKAQGKSWLWVRDWLDKNTVYAQLVSFGALNNGVTAQDVGKVLKLTPCYCGCRQYYTRDGKYAKKEWLALSSKEKYDKQNLEVGRKNDS